MTDDANEQGTIRYTRCAFCGSMNPASAPTCARCGMPQNAEIPPAPATPSVPTSRGPAPPAVPQVMCPKCHKSFPLGSKFCGYCGTPLPATAPQMATPPPPVARPASPSPPRPVPPPPGPPRSAVPSPPPVARPVPPPPARPVAPPPARPVAPTAVPPPPMGKPVAPPRMNIPASAMEGTVVFSGLRAAPLVEARISEKKPDGTFGKAVPIAKETLIGRENCDLNYPQDTLLSPRHASVAVREGKLVLRDLGSQNGSFIRQRQDTELTPGDVFLLGRELFRFNTQSLDESLNKGSTEGTMMWTVPKLQRGPLTAKLEHIRLNGEIVADYKLDKPETTVGRTTGDLVFKDDPYMSGTHARIIAQPGRFLLQDLRSRNGVYRRIRTEVELADGDEFFMGEQLFHVDLKNAG